MVLIPKYLYCVEKQLSVGSKILLISGNTKKAKQIKNITKFSNKRMFSKLLREEEKKIRLPPKWLLFRFQMPQSFWPL